MRACNDAANLAMGLANDAANLEMGPGNDASASTDSVSQPGPKEVSTDCVRQARPKEVSTASQSAGSKGSIFHVCLLHQTGARSKTKLIGL